jgi:membrane-bound ClpP family serine protease
MSPIAIALLILLGIILLLIEFLIIPGVTVAGVGGVLLIAGGVFAAYLRYGVMYGNITLATTVLVLIIIFIVALRTRTWKKIALDTKIDSSVENIKKEGRFMVGERGKTVTRLAPIGKAIFNNKIIEAKSISGYINENTEVEIIKIQNTNVIVKPLK